MKTLSLSWLLACTLSAPLARADGRLADLVERVAPSVVNLHSEGMQQPRSAWDAFFGGARRWESLGSGFVVDAERCLIVTNAHVVRDANSIQVATG